MACWRRKASTVESRNVPRNTCLPAFYCCNAASAEYANEEARRGDDDPLRSPVEQPRSLILFSPPSFFDPFAIGYTRVVLIFSRRSHRRFSILSFARTHTRALNGPLSGDLNEPTPLNVFFLHAPTIVSFLFSFFPSFFPLPAHVFSRVNGPRLRR